MELQTVKNDWAKKHTHTSFKQGLLSFFSGNINFNKYKDRFRQILVLELSGIVFSDSSSSFSSLLLFLFLLFFLLFSCSPSYLIVHPSLWRPLFPNRLLYFLSFIFSAFFFSLFPVNLCITSLSQILTWLLVIFLNKREIQFDIYNFFKDY